MLGFKEIMLTFVLTSLAVFSEPTDVKDLVGPAQPDWTNCTSTFKSPDVESGLRNTVYHVFSCLDEIFKRLLDVPLFYSVRKPDFKDAHKSLVADPSGTTDSSSEMVSPTEDYDSDYYDVRNLTIESVLSSPRRNARGARSRRTADPHGPKLQDHPYLVLIRRSADGAFVQTGAALSLSLVLTSASGLVDQQGHLFKPSELSVSTLSQNGSVGESKFPVANIHLSRGFKKWTDEAGGQDLALLVVVGMNSSHGYPSLAKTESKTLPKDCSVVSWNVPAMKEGQPVVPVLRQERVLLSDAAKCKQLFPSFNESSSFCSSGTKPLEGQHDRGAPLICSGELVGFVTLGTGQATTSDLHVYSRVTLNSDVITESKKQISLLQQLVRPGRTSQELFQESSISKRPHASQLTILVFLLATLSVHGLF